MVKMKNAWFWKKFKRQETKIPPFDDKDYGGDDGGNPALVSTLELAEVSNLARNGGSSKLDELLSSSGMIRSAWMLLYFCDLVSPETKTKKDSRWNQRAARELERRTNARLYILTSENVNDNDHGYWCWKFVLENISIIFAAICLQRHVFDADLVREGAKDENVRPSKLLVTTLFAHPQVGVQNAGLLLAAWLRVK